MNMYRLERKFNTIPTTRSSSFFVFADLFQKQCRHIDFSHDNFFFEEFISLSSEVKRNYIEYITMLKLNEHHFEGMQQDKERVEGSHQ